MKRYRQLAPTSETITARMYPETRLKYERGKGTKSVQDRYKTSAPSYPIPEYNYPMRKLVKNEDWQVPFIDPLTVISVALQQSYGSRYRVAGVANTGNRLVVIQNPTGPVQPTARGFQVMENNARLGRFIAEMNAASIVRRRRGQ